MKNEIKKLQKMIANLSEHSEMEISRYSKEDINEMKSYTIQYNFHFNIETDDNAYIKTVRELGRSLTKQVKYLSRRYGCSIGIDNSEYERMPRFGKGFDGNIIDWKHGFVRGCLILEIGDYDESSDYSKNISKLYEEMKEEIK